MFSFLIYTIRQDSLDGASARRKAAAYTQNKRTKTSMPRVGLEPTIPVFKRATTVHALGLAATVIGWYDIFLTNMRSVINIFNF
jgi:hypothetical protein